MFGGLATLWRMHISIQEWLLFIFVVLSLIIDEILDSSGETLLLEVMIFFDRVATHLQNQQDLFEALPNVIKELPEGRVRKSVLEAIQCRRSGESFENSLKAMHRIDPLLDEFVFTLKHLGWKNMPGLTIIINRLIVRAGRKWDRISWLLLIKDQIRNCVQFCQGAFIVGMWVILIRSLSALNRVMPDKAVIVLAVITVLGFGFIFYLFLTKQWLRRLLLGSISIIALIAYANSLTIPFSYLIQVETISHQSTVVRKTSLDTKQISTLNQGLPGSFLSTSIDKPTTSGISKSTSTPTPTFVATTILNPPVLISTLDNTQDFNLCCLRSPITR